MLVSGGFVPFLFFSFRNEAGHRDLHSLLLVAIVSEHPSVSRGVVSREMTT